MAEAALYLVITKIGVALGGEVLKLCTSLLADEVSLLTQLPSTMSRVRSEFSVIYAFLNEIESEKDNRTMVAWVEEVRKLAYHAEDIIDEFLYLAGQHRRSRFHGYLKTIIPKSKNMVAWLRIASQLKDIEAELEHLSKMKEGWIAMVDVGGGISSDYARELHQYTANSSNFVDRDEVVGVEENKKLISEWLATEESASSIISVWGMGGLGKTTLLTCVYESERKHFDCHAWISVSQNYIMEDLLRIIIVELLEKSPRNIPVNIATMDHRKLKETIRRYLEGKRYLIILDDVWCTKLFHDIGDVFIDNKCRSRVVISTRIGEVASLATDNRKLQLKSLQEKDAWDLFCTRAFWKENNRECPQELQSWARKIMLKCQGLPLAIASIGSFLSLKERTEPEWRKVYDQLSWELDTNPNLGHIKKILNLSYKYLPRNLKHCFLYCSIFPNDYLLHRKKLARLWIAEGFVEERGTHTLEDVAEDYLKELTHRCMLQVVKRNEFGRIQGCRMHDLMRELAISISKKECFTVVCHNTEILRINSIVRRLSVNRCNDQIQLSLELPRLRSFLMFGTAFSSSLLPSLLMKSRYLTVIDLQGMPIEKLPEEVCNLFNLHHLGLRGTKVKKLPKSLGRLWKLQTLDLACTEIEKLPDGVSKLTNLRHLFTGSVYNPIFGVFDNRRKVEAPSELCNLKGLHTLQGIEASLNMVGRLGNLTQLRSLVISKVRSIHCAEICSSIANMRFLSNLAILASEDSEVLQLVGLKLPMQGLQKLCIHGNLGQELVRSPFFQSIGCSLKSVSLGWCSLKEDPIPFLSHMSDLAALRLCSAYDGQLLCFREGWFPSLTELWLVGMKQLNQVEIEKGAMVRLDYLHMSNLGALKEVRGIQFLTSLQELYQEGFHPEFEWH